MGKFFNKGLKEEDKKEGLLKRLKNIEDKNEEQLKAIEDQKEIQTKIISKNKIKPPLLKSICKQEVKNKRINNEFQKWRAIRASVGGVGGVLAWVAWVVCLRGWRASVGGVLAWVAC